MNGLREVARAAAAAVAAAQTAIAPWLDLAIRLWLAQAFLVVQVHEMMAAPAPSRSNCGRGTSSRSRPM